MRTTTLLIPLLSLLTPALALQNIWVGRRTSCDPASHPWDWYVWFTDSPPCSEGTIGGPSTGPGSLLCWKDMTILGHQGIEFTGCAPARPDPGPPSEVFDDGVKALDCFGSYGNEDIECPNNCPGQSGTHIVRKMSLCEDVYS